MFNLILSLILKSKNFAFGLLGIIIFFILVCFVDNYFEAQNKVKEYQRIEAIVKTQNQNTKENVEIIKKRNINNSVADREQLLEQMFSE
jgi:hypothetical protein